MNLNYGMQAFYRAHGIEPCCGMCRHFQGEVVNLATGGRICQGLMKGNGYVVESDVCYAPQRAPGADDE